MKGLKRLFNCLIFIAFAVMSILNFILCKDGYRFIPISYTGFIAAFTAVSALYVFLSVKCRKEAGISSRIAALLMPVIMTIFAASLLKLLETDGIYSEQSAACAVLLVPVALIASLVVFLNHVKREWAKIVAGITAGVILGIYTVFCALYIFSVWFGSVELTRSVVSPDEAYTVEVITRDEGALGGSTEVCVRKINDDIFAGCGTFKKRNYTLKNGRWGVTYEILWKDSETVIVDEKEYYVPYFVSNNSKNNYSETLGIYVPNREPDAKTDTHGGFHGDGETFIEYKLTAEEIKMLNADVVFNDCWKKIDVNNYSDIYGVRADGIYTEGFDGGKFPLSNNGYFCVYNKKTGKNEFPEMSEYSFNYILCQYSVDDKTLLIFEQDT